MIVKSLSLTTAINVDTDGPADNSIIGTTWKVGHPIGAGSQGVVRAIVDSGTESTEWVVKTAKRPHSFAKKGTKASDEERNYFDLSYKWELYAKLSMLPGVMIPKILFLPSKELTFHEQNESRSEQILPLFPL